MLSSYIRFAVKFAIAVLVIGGAVFLLPTNCWARGAGVVHRHEMDDFWTRGVTHRTVTEPGPARHSIFSPAPSSPRN
jgi:hypothetical protein